MVTRLLERGRAAALRHMRDQVTITRPGPLAPGPTGRYEPTEQVIYQGPGKIQTYEPYEQAPEVAGHTATIQRYRLDLPVTAGPIEVGDVATVTAPRPPHTGPRTFRVAGLHEKTAQTAQRLLVDEIVR